MVKQLFSQNWLSPALRRNYPLTRFYLRKPPSTHVKQLIFGSSLGLFLLFGGLSLPMLYFLFSLITLLQLGTGTVQKVHRLQTDGIADLLNLTLLPRRQMVLSTWAAGIWQVRQTWLMLLYRLSHGFLLIGVLVFTITIGEISADKGMLVVIGITCLIAFQPYAEMYFSGMIGLVCATRIPDHVTALAAAAIITLVYWALWIAGALGIAFFGLKNLSAIQIAAVFALPILLPIAIGALAQRVTERTTL